MNELKCDYEVKDVLNFTLIKGLINDTQEEYVIAHPNYTIKTCPSENGGGFIVTFTDKYSKIENMIDRTFLSKPSSNNENEVHVYGINENAVNGILDIEFYKKFELSNMCLLDKALIYLSVESSNRLVSEIYKHKLTQLFTEHNQNSTKKTGDIQ